MHSSTPSPSHSPVSLQRPNRNGRPIAESTLKTRSAPFAQRDLESEELVDAEEEGDEEHDESHIDVVGETSSAEEDQGAEDLEAAAEMLEDDSSSSSSSEDGVAERSHWEKDYKHEEVFPQLHTRMSLPLVFFDKKRRVLIPSYHPAKGTIPSYLARPIDFDRVPKPSFRVTSSPLSPSGSSKKESPHSKKRVSFDAHPTDIFHEPGNSDDPSSPYQRFVLPSMAHYDRVVEYDMDEHDFAWLEIYNEERKGANLPEISEDVFELLVDRIEKEWYSYSQVHERPCQRKEKNETELSLALFSRPKSQDWKPPRRLCTRILRVMYASKPNANPGTPLYFVMAAISPFIKIVTESLTFPTGRCFLLFPF